MIFVWNSNGRLTLPNHPTVERKSRGAKIDIDEKKLDDGWRKWIKLMREQKQFLTVKEWSAIENAKKIMRGEMPQDDDGPNAEPLPK